MGGQRVPRDGRRWCLSCWWKGCGSARRERGEETGREELLGRCGGVRADDRVRRGRGAEPGELQRHEMRAVGGARCCSRWRSGRRYSKGDVRLWPLGRTRGVREALRARASVALLKPRVARRCAAVHVARRWPCAPQAPTAVILQRDSSASRRPEACCWRARVRVVRLRPPPLHPARDNAQKDGGEPCNARCRMDMAAGATASKGAHAASMSALLWCMVQASSSLLCCAAAHVRSLPVPPPQRVCSLRTAHRSECVQAPAAGCASPFSLLCMGRVHLFIEHTHSSSDPRARSSERQACA